MRKFTLKSFKILEKYDLTANGSFNIFVTKIDYHDKQYLERIFAFRKRKNKEIEWQEVLRKWERKETECRNLRFIMGYRAIWKDTKPAWSCYVPVDYSEDPESFGHCCFEPNISSINDFTLEEVMILAPELKYSGWNGKGSFIDFLKAYRECPYIEMLEKLNLNRLASKKTITSKLNKDKAFRKWIFKQAKWINEQYDITAVNLLNMYNKHITYEQAKEIDRITKLKREYTEILHTAPELNVEKVDNYIRNHNSYNNERFGEYDYKDYLIAAKYLKLDLKDTKNAYPKEFWKYHDLYTKQYKAAKDKELDENIEKTANKYKPILKTIDDVTMIFPTKTQDFIDEGKALNHCVGRMGYNEKMASGKSLIIFIRKKEDINKSFLTLEYDPSKKRVMQFYGDHDTLPSEEYQNIIYKKWLPSIRKVAI